jgi:hypothetical protein
LQPTWPFPIRRSSKWRGCEMRSLLRWSRCGTGILSC